MDLKNCKTITKEEYYCHKKQVDNLESSNMNLKSKILKLYIIENTKINDTDNRLEHNMKECKINFSFKYDRLKN